MSVVATTRVLVRCDGAEAPGWLAGLPWTRSLDIGSHGPKADLNLRVEDLAGVLGAEVGDRARDLVRIAAYAYQADRLVSRGGDRDADAAKWRRHLGLCVPVADPEYWSDPAVTDRLVATLQFLTDDRWDFAFGLGKPEQRQVQLLRGARLLHREPGAVVLFSGGADSLGVLLEAALRGERPLAVGHWSAPPHEARQRALLDRLRERISTWAFPPLGLRIHGVNTEPAERTQRTRAFLYAALGAAVASEVGVERVYLGDNGPVSLNLPISAQLVGALASRVTHPKFLAGFNHLLQGMFPAAVRIENPLWTRIRAEVLAVLKDAGCADVLQETLSCSRWSRLPGATPQCGTCSQCVDRRFAAITAGLEVHDRPERYVRDVFLHDLPEGHDRTTAESYVRFAQDVHSRSDEELLVAYPQLFDGVLPEDPDAAGTLATLVDLLRRHARATIRVLETMTRKEAAALAEGRLPGTCLLRLALAAPGVGPVVAAAPGRNLTPGRLAPEKPVGSAENVFAFDGQVWQLTYRGHTHHMEHGDGLTRIACLLREPRREFSAAELMAAAHPTSGHREDEADAQREGLWEERYAGGGTLVDEDTDAFVERNIRLLEQEATRARDGGQAERAVELEEEIAETRRYLKVTKGLQGKPRPFPENRSRKHDTVSKSIRRTLPRIHAAHPSLGEHLSLTISTSSPFAYHPEGKVTWRVHLPTP